MDEPCFLYVFIYVIDSFSVIARHCFCSAFRHLSTHRASLFLFCLSTLLDSSRVLVFCCNSGCRGEERGRFCGPQCEGGSGCSAGCHMKSVLLDVRSSEA